MTMPGTIDRLDWHFYRKYGESFIEHLIKKPDETYQALLDYYGVDTPGELDSVKYIVYMALNTLFLNNKRFVNRAYEAFLNNNWNLFKKVIREFLKTSSIR